MLEAFLITAMPGIAFVGAYMIAGVIRQHTERVERVREENTPKFSVNYECRPGQYIKGVLEWKK